MKGKDERVPGSSGWGPSQIWLQYTSFLWVHLVASFIPHVVHPWSVGGVIRLSEYGGFIMCKGCNQLKVSVGLTFHRTKS